MVEFRKRADGLAGRPVSRTGLALVIGLWLLGGALMLWWLLPWAATARG